RQARSFHGDHVDCRWRCHVDTVLAETPAMLEEFLEARDAIDAIRGEQDTPRLSVSLPSNPPSP
ncbi:MAG: hypothetical protein CME96_08945, partial [Hyphomonas sp.]|nr:hypothetical protein [Hyphomonas sp.]